jgi:hypothetical protein
VIQNRSVCLSANDLITVRNVMRHVIRVKAIADQECRILTRDRTPVCSRAWLELLATGSGEAEDGALAPQRRAANRSRRRCPLNRHEVSLPSPTSGPRRYREVCPTSAHASYRCRAFPIQLRRPS